VILALIITILIQVPFAFIFILPSFFPGIPTVGALFFAPAFAITRLFVQAGSISIVATLVIQTALTFIPIFWVVTWKRRAALNTLARVFGFSLLVIAATAITIPLERRHDARAHALQINGRSPVLSSIQRLNGSLEFFKKRYGQYPDSLAQLDFPPDQADVDAQHAGLIQFPLPMQDFFDFTYRRQGTGYDLRVDGRPRQGWELYHYCTDDSATIHFDTSSDRCTHGAVVYTKTH